MKMKVRVITSSSTFVLEEVTSLHLSLIDGDITILPNHYPLLGAIEISKVVFKKNKEEICAFASKGLLNVKEDDVLLVLDAFEFKKDIDYERALRSKNRALERINSNDSKIDIVRAEASLKRALMRISIYEI